MMKLAVALCHILDDALEAIERVMQLHEPVLCTLPSSAIRSESDRRKRVHTHCKTCGPRYLYPCPTVNALLGNPEHVILTDETFEDRTQEVPMVVYNA